MPRKTRGPSRARIKPKRNEQEKRRQERREEEGRGLLLVNFLGTISDAAVRKQLREVEKLQKTIVAQQRELEPEFEKLRNTSAAALSKLKDIDKALSDNISPELESIIKELARCAVSIDQKVPD